MQDVPFNLNFKSLEITSSTFLELFISYFIIRRSTRSTIKFALLLFLVPMISSSQESELISFELEDQFDKIYTDQDFHGSIFFVIASDKGGSKYNPIWSEAVYNELNGTPVSSQFKLAGIADMSSVPFFLKRFIKNKFPKDKEKWVLMDWKGKFAKTYKLIPRMSNILIFDQEGHLVHQTSAKEMDTQKLALIIQKIKALERG